MTNVCCSFQMKELNLSRCIIGDEGFIAMSPSIHNVEGLFIGNEYDDRLTITGISALSEAVQKLPKPVSIFFSVKSLLLQFSFGK